MPRHRTQLLLDPDQHRAVAQVARAQHRSVSDVVRQFIALGLERLRRDREQRLEALDRLVALREHVEEQVGTYPRDPVAEARAERDQQLKDVLAPVGSP